MDARKLRLLKNQISALILEKTQEGIGIIQGGKFVFSNPRLAEITGYVRNGLTGIPSQAVLAPQDMTKILVPAQTRKAGDGLSRFHVLSIRHKNGHDVAVEMSGERVRLDGKAAKIIFVRDVGGRVSAEDELQQMVDKLRKSMGATLQAINLTVEMRDPYTAGHQRRVADLARAIADELGVPKDRVDAIRLAASIHDIGKLSVPTDILSKPGRLNHSEFELVKTHPQVGFDILKQIEFPGPVAQIVLQHHERLDGSGYPQGLREQEIILEARILGVADVVETMVSHRPYRSAFDLEEALHEIVRNRGVLYDQAVVDACRSLFHDHKYEFK